MIRSDHGWEYEGIRFKHSKETPSGWCERKFEETWNTDYLEMYNMWKEREDAKVRSNSGNS